MLDILVKPAWIQNRIPALIIKCMDTLSENKKLKKAVIIYHSFAHAKENTIFIGYELAMLGYICICVDLDRHGERENVTEKFPYQHFYNCMFQTALEIDAVINFLVQQEAVEKDDITVMGISLGGMAALSASVIDKRVQNIITIASSANFTELAKHRRKPTLARILSDNQYNMDDVVNHTLQLSKKYDPYYNLGEVKSKNILMINGGLDTEIPISIVKDFQQKLSKESGNIKSKRDFIIINGLGHQIQNVMIRKACIWLQQIYSDKN